MPFPLAQLAAAALLATGAGPGPVHNGRARDIEVRPPRVEGAITVDGRLDEPAWQQAARLTGFSRYAPSDGAPADDSTEVLVWYSATALHVGIRAWAPPGTVRATLADRDKIYADDYIGIFLGTYNDGRQATVLAVNPLGQQGDGVVVESGIPSSAGSGGATAAGREATDITPDYVFESKGRLTDFGFEVELRIPFKSLTFQAAEAQTWTFNVIRKVQARGQEYSWVPALRTAPTYIGQHGHLAGLTGLDRGLVLDVTPIVTTHVDGAAGAGGYAYGQATPQYGGNVRWGITNNLTLSGTINPDFAEVEADAGQFVTDPRQSLFFTEKRPFFLEGAEQFATPNSLVYTRRILAPVAAAKVTGKVAGTGVALLTAVDDTPGSLTGTDRPVFTILRLSRDIGAGSRLGFLYTGKEEPTGNNRVVDADARFVLGREWSARLQLGLARTERAGQPTRTGPFWVGYLSRSTRNLTSSLLLSGIHDNFITQAGFISRPAMAHFKTEHAWTWYGAEGGWWQTLTADVVVDGLWQYQGFVHGQDALEKKLILNQFATFRGGWQLAGNVYVEQFAYDPGLYTNYFIERRVGAVTDTVKFRGRDHIPNTDWAVTLTSPEFRTWSVSTSWLWGRDENFFEWASADILYASLGATWRPTGQLRVNATYNWQRFRRGTDGSTVGEGRIPRVKVEYQLSRAIFLRLVGQYTSTERDSLRDEGGTGFPILLKTATGFTRAGPVHQNALRTDLLFSYQPSPGTVFFAGYGSLVGDQAAFAFRDLARTTDGFFVKASWLFRS